MEEIKITKEWLEEYERNKNKLICRIDLDKYFTEKEIGGMKTDVLEIGEVNIPTGRIVACDPLVELGDVPPYIQETPKGKFPVKICVVLTEEYGNRYAGIKVEFTKEKPVKYELAVLGNERNMDDIKENEFYGFGVDAGMGCVVDASTAETYKNYIEKLEENEEFDNPYDDIFEEVLEESYKNNPKYQRKCGDWANWTIPNTDLNVPIFASGWGDGVYPAYFGYDAEGKICAFYIHFIDIETEFSEYDGKD